MVRLIPETLSDLWEILNYSDHQAIKEYLGVSIVLEGFTADHFAC